MTRLAIGMTLLVGGCESGHADPLFVPPDLRQTPRDMAAAADDLAMAIGGGDLPAQPAVDLAEGARPDLAVSASPDLGQESAVVFTVTVDNLFQNCQPIVAPDPLQASGTLTATNNGAAPAGPFEARSAALTDANTVYLGTFDITPIAPFMVPAKKTVTFPVKKVAGSFTLKMGCQSVKCGSDARVAVYVMSGAANAAKPISTAVPVQCAF